jgi:hypothetical protein
MESAAQAALSVFRSENATSVESLSASLASADPIGTLRPTERGRELAMQTSDE